MNRVTWEIKSFSSLSNLPFRFIITVSRGRKNKAWRGEDLYLLCIFISAACISMCVWAELSCNLNTHNFGILRSWPFLYRFLIFLQSFDHATLHVIVSRAKLSFSLGSHHHHQVGRSGEISFGWTLNSQGLFKFWLSVHCIEVYWVSEWRQPWTQESHYQQIALMKENLTDFL